jgi:hypothetical protein
MANATTPVIQINEGNVGIGTTSPKDTLAVNGTIAKCTTTGYDGAFDNFIKYGFKGDLEGTGQNLDRWIGADATITAGAAAANKLKFKVYSGGASGSPIDVMTLNGAGNVGVGTTSPSGRFQVSSANAGDDQIWLQSTTYTGGYSKLGYNASTGEFRITQNDGGVGTTFYTGSGTPSERMRITSAGGISFGSTGTAYGTSGQILKSNANASPTWVDASTVIGGPYLPLTAGLSYPLTGDLFIEGVSTPKITLTDTTNNLEGRIRVANNYMYIEADDSNAVNSTRILIRTDGVEALRLDENQNATFAGTITVSGGDITLSGTGRIQGVDTVSANTDAANRAYVDDKTWDWNDITTGTPPTFNQNTTGNAATATSLPSFDTRSTNPAPNTTSNGVRYDFKTNTTNGLSDGGTYNGQMTWRSYSNTTDLSGGMPMNIAYTANGNLWTRIGATATTWGTWYKLWSSGNDGAGSGLDADLLDGQHASAFQAAGTYNTIIGTDTDISYTGATVLSTMTMTDGVVESHSSRTLTLGDLGYTGATNANNYVHPTHPGDDFSVDTGALTGAVVVSDIDINVTTDTLGHVTDANGTVSTRTLTLGDLGYTGATNANNYVHPTHPGDDIDLDTGALTGATVISDLDFNITTDTLGHVTDANATYSTRSLTASDVGATPLDDIRSLGTQAFTGTATTDGLISEMEADGAFDSYSSVFKTSWSYAGNFDLTDAGRFTETAGTSWITWTDNSSDSTRGNITALAIAPNTGGSAGKVFIYNDQGSTYNPGWREVWTSTSDGSGSGLDADLLDGQHASAFQLALTNPVTGTGTTNYLSKFTGSTTLGNSLVYDNGTNVGIGTPSPGVKLDLYDATVSGTSLRIRNISAQLQIESTSAGDASIYFLPNSTGSQSAAFRVTDGYNFAFRNATGAEYLRIKTASGNVGINTTNPTEKLAVTGNIETTETANGVKIGFNVGDSFTLNGADTAHYGLSCGSSASVPLVLSGYYGVAIATNGLERVRILQSNGYVGILNTGPSYALDVTGTIRATGNVIAFSDARVKENIKTIDSALEKVNKLRGVEFNKIGEEKTCIGVIAQEVEEVLPEVVETDDNGMKAVAYGNMVGLLIEAMKEQQKQIDELKAKLESYGS